MQVIIAHRMRAQECEQASMTQRISNVVVSDDTAASAVAAQGISRAVTGAGGVVGNA